MWASTRGAVTERGQFVRLKDAGARSERRARVRRVREPNQNDPAQGRTPHRRRAGRGTPAVGIDQLKSRESRTRWDELQYFMVNAACVRCRKTVQAPVDRLQYKLRCPHCGTLMHLREDGKWYEGIHPSLAAQSRKQGAAAAAGRLATIPILRNRFARIVIAVGVIALLGWLAVSALRSPPDNLPTALQPRANMAAQAVFQGDLQKFLQFVDARTTDDARQWYAAVRAQLDRAVGEYQIVTVDVLFENRTDGVAATICRFQSTSRGDLHYAIYWRRDSEGSWRLDGARTLREM